MRDSGDDDAVLEAALLRLEREVGGRLDEWAAAEWADIAAAERKTSAEERQQAVRAFQRLAAGGGGSLSRRRALLTAAAALLGGLFGGWMARGALERAPDAGAPVVLGGVEGRALAPVGAVDRYERFVWTVPAGGAQRFGLRVWSGAGFEPVLRVDGLSEPAYAPTPEEEERLGAEIRWEVLLQDADGHLVGRVATATASLRSR